MGNTKLTVFVLVLATFCGWCWYHPGLWSSPLTRQDFNDEYDFIISECIPLPKFQSLVSSC